ncbi:hypothetical protein [Marinobacterium aestuariivivens]|uniref:Cytochrome c domain-containing protein n=1 Tax=Marinobacterium aestuariivivens TaxID=1698799 RepID=A0ABW2A7A7_9GAMM
MFPKVFCITTLLASLAAAGMAAGDPTEIERGRYLVAIGGCNDCHSPGYETLGEAMPESQRLLGAELGFAGPWGVSYPANLRLSVAGLSESAWMNRARAGGLPPMPWNALRAMSESDLRALYRYLAMLGPAGQTAPAAVAPGRPVETPYLSFEPVMPGGGQTITRH